MNPTVARFGSVHIIETLRPRDLPTGERLSRWLQPVAAAMNPSIEVHLWRESTAASVLERLEHVVEDVRKTRRAPVVQIEAHGCPQGIQTASGELLSWEALRQPLTDINVTCRLNLLVLLAACDGAGLGKIVQPTDRAPVWAILGPQRPMDENEIEQANLAFYRTLFSTRNGGLAWQAMNDVTKKGDRPFLLFHAQTMFKWVMREYFREHCNEEALARRELLSLAHVEELAKRGAHQMALAKAHDAFRAYIRDHSRLFDETRQRFFLCDLCPENYDRFPITLQECMTQEDLASARAVV